MDYSCRNCMSSWGCSWCYNTFCDCVNEPYVLEGKPQKQIFCKKDWTFLTEKEEKKMARRISKKEPQKTNFLLCRTCKEQYIESNFKKGRKKEKIGKNNTTFF